MSPHFATQKPNVSAETSRKPGRHLLAFNSSPQTSTAAHTHAAPTDSGSALQTRLIVFASKENTWSCDASLWCHLNVKCRQMHDVKWECFRVQPKAKTGAFLLVQMPWAYAGDYRSMPTPKHPTEKHAIWKCRSGSLSNIRTSDAHGLVCVEKTPTVDYYYTMVGFRNAFTAVVHTAL